MLTFADELAASARSEIRTAPVPKWSETVPVDAAKVAAADCRSWCGIWVWSAKSQGPRERGRETGGGEGGGVI